MRWLTDLQRKLNEVPVRYLIFHDIIKPEERIIGVLPEDLRRLYGLHLQMQDDMRTMLDQHARLHRTGGIHTIAACHEFYEQMYWMLKDIGLVRDLFWVTVRTEFEVHDRSIGIREHGIVVSYRTPEEKISLGDDAAQTMLANASCPGKPN